MTWDHAHGVVLHDVEGMRRFDCMQAVNFQLVEAIPAKNYSYGKEEYNGKEKS